MSLFSKSIALALMLGMILVVAPQAQAKTWTVNKAGGAGVDFTDWSDALLNAQLAGGDTIQFTDAAQVIYDESAAPLDWPATANVTVTAANPGAVTLRGRINVSNTTFTLSNLTIDQSGQGQDAVIYQNNAQGVYNNCTFKRTNPTGSDAHLIWADAGTVTATGCTFRDTASEGSSAFLGDWGATLNATHCHFPNVGGWVIRSGANGGYHVNLDHCDITNAAYHIFVAYGGSINATDCEFASANTGGYGMILNAPAWDGAKTPLTVKFARCKLSTPERNMMIYPGYTADVTVDLENCVLMNGAYAFWTNSDTGSATTKATNCVFYHLKNAVTGGEDQLAGTVIVRDSVIDATCGGSFTAFPTATIDTDYNLINAPGGFLGAHDMDGRTTAIDPKFVNAAGEDFHIQASSPCVGMGVLTSVVTDWDGEARPQPAGATKCDIGIDEIMGSARTWIVNKTAGAGVDFTDWSDALANPQMANGDTIQFTDNAAVIYDESALPLTWPALQNITVTAKNPGMVTLRGRLNIREGKTYAFANLTLDRNGAGLNEDAIVRAADSYGTFTNCTLKLQPGTTGNICLLLIENGAVTATNCTFSDTFSEGAHAFWGLYTATLDATDCHFINIGGWCFRSDNNGFTVNLTRCDVQSVYYNFAVTAGTINATDCTLVTTNNGGYGSIFYSPAFDQAKTAVQATFKRCTLSTADRNNMIVPGYTADATVDIENCLIKNGNYAIWTNSDTGSATTRVTNCVFYNIKSAITGGEDKLSGTVIFRNNIIDASCHASFTAFDSATIDTDYNLVNAPGGFIGTHDLDGRPVGDTPNAIDPQFIDAAGGNFHIQSTSPCAGKGLLTAVTTDWDNEPRPQPASAGACDIGLDEINEGAGFNAVDRSWFLY